MLFTQNVRLPGYIRRLFKEAQIEFMLFGDFEYIGSELLESGAVEKGKLFKAA